MSDSDHPVARLVKRDRRYRLEAYAFVFEALNYAHQALGFGAERSSEPEESEVVEDVKLPAAKGGKGKGSKSKPERHLTGQQLCEAIRIYALDQYGLMAKVVLNSWGVRSTGDFGEIVFNLIKIKQMKKTKDDRREDFDDVFDFDTGLSGSYQISLPPPSPKE